MQLFLQLSKLRGTTSYFDENVGRVGVKSDTVLLHNGKKSPDLTNLIFLLLSKNELAPKTFMLI